jgi:hypothetical protein
VVSVLIRTFQVTFLALALFFVVACTAESVEPTSTPVPLVGIRGAAGLGDPAYPSYGNGGYDVSHYDLDLTIDVEADTLDGVATITVMATANLLSFNFDYAGPEVSEVLVNGEPADFSREDFELVIEPGSVIPDGSEFTVRVTYGGIPEPVLVPDFPFAMGWVNSGNAVMVHGVGFAWHPKNQSPFDKATYELRLTVPKPLNASASGGLVATLDNGDTSTYVWELTTPAPGAAFEVSNSVLEVAAGPDGLVLNNYFPRGIPQAVKDEFSNNAEIIELFTDLFGPFPHDSYGMTYLDMRLPFGGFASPHRAYVLYLDEQLVAHEIAHSWFGASVSGASSSTRLEKVLRLTRRCCGSNTPQVLKRMTRRLVCFRLKRVRALVPLR